MNFWSWTFVSPLFLPNINQHRNPAARACCHYINKCFSLCWTKVPATNSQQRLQLRISGKHRSFLIKLHHYFSPTSDMCGSAHSLSLEAIERLVQGLIVPFISNQLVIAVDDGKGIDQGGAQEGVHILGHVLSFARSILGPVGEVTHHLGGTSCVEGSIFDKRVHNLMTETLHISVVVNNRVLQLTEMAHQKANAYREQMVGKMSIQSENSRK